MKVKRNPSPTDVALAEIDDWGRWFLSSHMTRLRESDLTPIEYGRQAAAVQAMATGVVERMKVEFLARQQR